MFGHFSSLCIKYLKTNKPIGVETPIQILKES